MLSATASLWHVTGRAEWGDALPSSWGGWVLLGVAASILLPGCHCWLG